MKNILVPIDFSDVSDEVIKEGAKFAKAFNAKLWIVHVAAPDPEFVGYEVGPQHERDWRAGVLRKEHKVIQDAKKKLENDGIDAEGLLIQGLVTETILNEARKLKADLIVVGSHGHGALLKLLMGSVCEGLVRKASCPILIIPANRALESVGS